MKLLTRPITDYKKITNDLLWLDNKFRLRFIVEMYYKDRDKNSKYYVSEFNPDSKSSYIYMDLKYHLNIESVVKDEFSGNKVEFRISNSNMYQFIIALESASQWLTNSQYANLFAKMSNGYIKCMMDVQPIIISDIFKHKLSLQPGVYNDDSRNDSGIIMYIDDSDSIFINSSLFMNFKYFIDHFNMYQSALQIVTWLGKPTDGDSYNSTTSFVKRESNTTYDNNGFLSRVNAKERKDD